MSKTSCPSCGIEFQRAHGNGPENSTGPAAVCPRCKAPEQLFAENTLVTSRIVPNRQYPPKAAQIAGYEVMGVLGRGGMGLVYEGRQISLGRRVAIKFLMPTLADSPEFVERFNREASVLARLSHPNIVTIYERGTTGAGVYFIMEYVEGPGGGAPEDLRAVLRSRRLSEAEVIRLSLQVVRALGFAHQMGIVHRDIKPSNIMLDRHGHAKVADFGIALLDSEGTGAELTGPSTPLGTLEYMAPEQRKNSSLVDSRADIYSAGVMLYEMLTGVLPRGSCMRPSAIVPTLHSRWDDLLDQMLQPDAQRRLGDLRQVAEQLEALETQILRPPMPGPGSGSVAVSEIPLDTCCADCGTLLGREVRFCPVCSLLQWMNCPRCHQQVHSSARFCVACGSDILGHRMLQKYSSEAQSCLELARDTKQPLLDRCQHAQQAGLAAARAVKHAAENDGTKSLLQTINEYHTGLLRQALAEAVSGLRLGEACLLLQQIQQLAITDTDTDTQLTRIRAYFTDRVERAERLFAKGRFQSAIHATKMLLQQFPEDASLRQRLESYIRRQQETEDIVHRLIPQLREQKRWFSMRRELIELKKTGISGGSLIENWNLVRREFSAIEGDLRAAREAFRSMRIKEARLRAETVLHHIVDHPVALRILERVKTIELSAQQLNKHLRVLVSEGNFFSAAAMVRSADKHVRSLLLKDLCRRIQHVCQRAENYRRFLTWLLTGFVMIFPVAWTPGILLRGIEGLLPSAAVVHVEKWHGAIQESCMQFLFVLTAIAGISAVRIVVGRRVSMGSIAIWAILGLEGIATGQFFQLVLVDLIPSTEVTACLARLGIGAAMGGVFAMASQDLVQPERQRFLRGVVSGVLAVFFLELEDGSPEQYTRFLLPGLWLGGLLFLTGRIRHLRGVVGILIGALIAGVLITGILQQDPKWSESQMDLAGMAILSFVTVLHASNARLITILLTCSLAWLAIKVCIDLTDTDRALTSWLILNLALIADSHRDLDFRLFLRDRLRASKLHTVPAIDGGQRRWHHV